jgi:hypothetical protein
MLLEDIEIFVGLLFRSVINEDFYLLLTFDSKIRKFDNLITKKIIPIIKEQTHRFVSPAD